MIFIKEPCPACGATGKINDVLRFHLGLKDDKCPACHGTGEYGYTASGKKKEEPEGEIQSKFKKVTMKENGEIEMVIGDGAVLSKDDLVLKTTGNPKSIKNECLKKDISEYIEKFKGRYMLCPSCYGQGAFEKLVFCSKCNNTGVAKSYETEKTFINPPERDWEVIEFTGTSYPDKKYKLQPDGTYKLIGEGQAPIYTLEHLLFAIAPIHSVRRKSDNTLWHIGRNTNFGEIQEFKVAEGKILAAFKDKDWQDLSELKDVPLPLFTTNDGVKIYEDMPYFVVCMNFDIACHTAGTVKPNDDFISRTFHDKAKANEYVEYNKPVELIFSYAGITYEIKAKNKPQADCFEGIILNPPKSGFGPHITVKK